MLSEKVIVVIVETVFNINKNRWYKIMKSVSLTFNSTWFEQE
jgi:hypothetical protein